MSLDELILDLRVSLENQLRLEYARLNRIAFQMAFGYKPTADAASDAFDSAYDQLEHRIARLHNIIERRYGTP